MTKRGALRQAVDLCKMKGYLKLRQPSLCRVAVVAFYANCDGETKHMKSQRNGHAHHLLSVNDGQPPALWQCSSYSFELLYHINPGRHGQLCWINI